MLALLDHENRWNGFYAAQAVLRIDPRQERALAILRAAVSDAVEGKMPPARDPFPPETHVFRALDGLGPLAAPAVPEMIQALRAADARPVESEAGLRRSAARALGELGPAATPAIPALVDSLAGRPRDWQEVATALAKISPQQVPPQLVQALEEGKCNWYQALWPFGQASIPVMVQALKHPRPAVRCAAVKAMRDLCFFNNERALVELQRATKDRDPEVRAAAAAVVPDVTLFVRHP